MSIWIQPGSPKTEPCPQQQTLSQVCEQYSVIRIWCQKPKVFQPAPAWEQLGEVFGFNIQSYGQWGTKSSWESVPCVQPCCSHCPPLRSWENSEKCFTGKNRKALIRCTRIKHAHLYLDFISYHRVLEEILGRPVLVGPGQGYVFVQHSPHCWFCRHSHAFENREGENEKHFEVSYEVTGPHTQTHQETSVLWSVYGYSLCFGVNNWTIHDKSP